MFLTNIPNIGFTRLTQPTVKAVSLVLDCFAIKIKKIKKLGLSCAKLRLSLACLVDQINYISRYLSHLSLRGSSKEVSFNLFKIFFNKKLGLYLNRPQLLQSKFCYFQVLRSSSIEFRGGDVLSSVQPEDSQIKPVSHLTS